MTTYKTVEVKDPYEEEQVIIWNTAFEDLDTSYDGFILRTGMSSVYTNEVERLKTLIKKYQGVSFVGSGNPICLCRRYLEETAIQGTLTLPATNGEVSYSLTMSLFAVEVNVLPLKTAVEQKLAFNYEVPISNKRWVFQSKDGKLQVSKNSRTKVLAFNPEISQKILDFVLGFARFLPST